MLSRNILAVQLTELLQVLDRGGVAGQMEEDVLQGAGMSVRQDESITVSLTSMIERLSVRK